MKKQNISLNMSHAVVDGLFESIPVLLAFVLLLSLNPEKEIGLVVSIGIMMSTILGLSTKALTQKTSSGFVFFLALLIYGCAFIMAAFAQSVFVTKVCFVLAISVSSLFHVAAFSHLLVTTDVSQRGKVISNFTAIGDVGRIPFVSVASFVSAYTVLGISGWRTTCLFFGLLASGLALYAYKNLYGQNAPAQIHEKKQSQKNFLPSFSLLKDRACRLPIIACVCDAFCSSRLFTFFPLFLLEKGIDATSIVYFTFIFTFGSLLGKIVLGRAADRIPPAAMFMGSELTMASALIMLVLTNSPVLLFCLAALLGVVARGTVPVAQLLVTNPVKEEHYSDIITIRDFGTGIVGIITPVFYGYIATYLGIQSIYILMACGAAAASIPIFLSFGMSSGKK